jgi:DNA-binding CsgD family transcriptional regulator
VALSARDIRQVVGFLQRAADAPDGDPFSRPMLRELGALIGADLVEYFEIRQADRAGLAYTTSDDQQASPDVVDGFERYRHQNPIGAFRWTPGAGAVVLSSVVSARKLRGLGFYQSFLRPLHIQDQLKVWLRRSPETAVCVSLDRSDGVFSEREAAMLEVLQPHLRLLHDGRRAAARTALPDDARLTRREAQILVCVLAGHRTREIADLLVISPNTVRKHLEHAYAKLGVRGRAEAAAAFTDVRPGPG